MEISRSIISRRYCLSGPVSVFVFVTIILIHLPGVVFASPDLFRDSENCLLCHTYPTFGRYGRSGELRIFYISGQAFADSIHSKLRCTECHLGLDRIPHADIKKVDCSTKCHIRDHSTGGLFSHQELAGKYEASVHGRRAGESSEVFPEDLPACIYCHNNHSRNSPEWAWSAETGVSREVVSAYRHPISYLRTQKKVIELCGSCHGDREKMARHGLESIKTYKDTFHWQALKYGVINAPDCISCHVPLGHSSHTIRPVSDPLSPVNIANRVRTCSNA
ncbi:MAG: hypothetical protein OEU95_02970, partial [Nitrospirota bacterium]|nr:hypothetical protein [Nitrospirota bacterium]